MKYTVHTGYHMELTSIKLYKAPLEGLFLHQSKVFPPINTHGTKINDNLQTPLLINLYITPLMTNTI